MKAAGLRFNPIGSIIPGAQTPAIVKVTVFVTIVNPADKVYVAVFVIIEAAALGVEKVIFLSFNDFVIVRPGTETA